MKLTSPAQITVITRRHQELLYLTHAIILVAKIILVGWGSTMSQTLSIWEELGWFQLFQSPIECLAPSCTYYVCICVNSSCTSLKWKPLEFELQILTSNLFLFMCLDPPLPPIIRERVSSISLTGINNWRVGTTSSNILLENFKDFLGKTSCIYFHNKH